ncbi:hypothetical protein ACJW30_09G047900 [Castanea mollissima]
MLCFCFCFSISSIDMISISSNSTSTLQVKAVANPRSIFLQGVRESIKIAHSIAHSIVSASLYYINSSNSQSLKLSFKIIYQMARTKSKFNVNPTTNAQANQ